MRDAATGTEPTTDQAFAQARAHLKGKTVTAGKEAGQITVTRLGEGAFLWHAAIVDTPTRMMVAADKLGAALG